MPAIVMEQTRGPLVENRYRADVAVVDSQGRLLYQVGDAQKATFWRSSAKPIQVLPVITTGAAAAFGFGPEEIAIFCASHNGEDVHVAAVTSAQRKAGLSPELLQCGVHAPFDKESAAAIVARGAEPTALHNNCSGKHTGMLAIAKHMGYPLDDYLEPSSDLQQLILKHVASVVGLAPEQIAIGTDGCGVPVFGMPLYNMALSFARLAAPNSAPEHGAALAQVASALRQQPYLVAGRRRICTTLMGFDGLLAKSGAEGVYCVGIQPEMAAKAGLGDQSIGIAVKVEDGAQVVREALVVEALRQLGIITGDEEGLSFYRPKVIKNHAGKVVGEQRLTFNLERMV